MVTRVGYQVVVAPLLRIVAQVVCVILHPLLLVAVLLQVAAVLIAAVVAHEVRIVVVALTAAVVPIALTAVARVVEARMAGAEVHAVVVVAVDDFN